MIIQDEIHNVLAILNKKVAHGKSLDSEDMQELLLLSLIEEEGDNAIK